MKIRFASKSPAVAGSVVVLVSQAARWSGRAAELDDACSGQLGRACRVSQFRASAAEIVEILAPAGVDASRVLVVGTGDLRNATAADLERLGGALCARVLASGETALTVEMPDLEASGASLDAAAAASHLALGARLRTYRFDRYKTAGGPSTQAQLKVVTVVTSRATDAQASFKSLEAVAAGVFLARDLVSEPPNVLHPVAFADRIRELSAHGIRVQVLGRKRLEQLGFGALLGVAQGSIFEPQVVLCEYDGTRGKRRTPPVVLAGKGVTFDAGGISIKPSAGLETLKQDMGGAASIVGVLKTLALRKARCHVVGICGLVENMPSGTAQRPGDVVKSLSGKTVEIINTDAEGRLVLCDILWYAQERYRPRVVIDMATLTGAIAITLGEEYAGLFCNDDVLAGQLTAAGAATGDRLWRYPMGAAYDRHLESQIADMKNIGPDKGRAIIAAQFIKRFVQEGVAWAHVDFGMMVWAESDTPVCPVGATGFGVRLLDRLIADHFETR